MSTAPVFSPNEAAIVYDAALAGKKAPTIALILADSGFHCQVSSVYRSQAYRKARAELRNKAEAIRVPKPGIVQCGDLIIRKTIRLVPAQSKEGGDFIEVPVSLSAGVNWQVPA